ncbi:MAG: peptidoglycan-binding protein [Candidatus Pacebacteria bacterium]|nr:peptidoglycan-binding protein [Candidatus Paceibacterota bacterium]
MVAILQAQLQSLGGDMNLSEILERTLRISMLGDDVLKLQQFLNSDPATQLAVVGAGSPGNETRYFGPLTDAAVKKFQEKHGLTVDGIVGPKTLAVIKALLGR